MLNPLAIKGAQIFLDLALAARAFLVERDADLAVGGGHRLRRQTGIFALDVEITDFAEARDPLVEGRSEEHTSELQSLMRTSYAVFCLTKTTNKKYKTH